MVKISRNEKCPCGSGFKYKKCCLRNNVVVKQEPIDSIVDRLAGSFKDVHVEWKKFLAEEQNEEDYSPEEFEIIWPDAVNDALSEDWVSWEDLLVPPTEEAKEKFYKRYEKSKQEWSGDLQKFREWNLKNG